VTGLKIGFYRAQALALTVLLCGAPACFGQGRLPTDGTTGGAYAPNPRAVSLYNLGLTAYKQNSPESAIIFFKRACDIDPNLADAQYNLGVIYQLQKRYKEAGPRFEEVLRIKPTDPDAHYQLGIIMQETGRPNEARQHLSAIAPNNPHFTDSQRRLNQISSDPGATAVQPPDGLRGADTNAAASNPYASTPGAFGTQQTPTAPLAQTPAYSQPPTQPPASQPPLAQPYTPAAALQPPATQPPAYGGQPNYSQPQTQTAYAAPQQPAAVAAPPAAASPGPVPTQANLSLRTIATGFSAPSGLAFDRSGNLYVANYMSNCIDRIGPDGSRSTFCTGASIRGPIGLICDDSGNIFVANYNGGTVAKVSPAGISTVIASGFKKPYYLTLDKDGNLYVSQQEDNSIVRITIPRALGSKPTP
jgi:hypothetical protein